MPLIQAAIQGNIVEVKRLLIQDHRLFCDELTEDGQDALQYICAQQQIDEKQMHDYIEVIKVLLENANANNLSINELDIDGNGQTALMYTMENNHKSIVAIFLQKEYKGLIDAQVIAGGRTHLHMAARCGFQNVAEVLLEQGADIDARDQIQRTPLHWAASHNHQALFQFLLSKGAKSGAKDRDGNIAVALMPKPDQKTQIDQLQQQIEPATKQESYNVSEANPTTPVGLPAHSSVKPTTTVIVE